MKVVYRPHLKRRVKERRFPEDYPRKIYQTAKAHYFDEATKHKIAVAKLKYAGKIRNLAISYDILGKNIEVITIHPVSDKELTSKTRAGRWKKL